jgi:hypothetical protein
VALCDSALSAGAAESRFEALRAATTSLSDVLTETGDRYTVTKPRHARRGWTAAAAKGLPRPRCLISIAAASLYGGRQFSTQHTGARTSRAGRHLKLDLTFDIRPN